MRQDLANDYTYISPGTIQERSPDIFSLIDELGDGIDRDYYMEPDAEKNSEQLSPTDANPRSTKFDLRHNPKPICNDYRHYFEKPVFKWYPEQLRTP